MGKTELETFRKNLLSRNIGLSLSIFCIGSALLITGFGGFPPTSWRFLIQTLPDLTLLWHLKGTRIFLPFTILTLHAFFLLCAWSSLLFASFRIITLPVGIQASFQFTPSVKIQQQQTASSFSANTTVLEPEIAEHEQIAAVEVFPSPLEEMDFEDFFVNQAAKQKSTPLTLQIAVRSDVGKIRRFMLNEDRVFAQQWKWQDDDIFETRGLLLVVDGDGRAMRGLEASRLVVQSIVDAVMPFHKISDSYDQLLQRFKDSIQEANRILYQSNRQDDAALSATMAGLLVSGLHACAVQLGNCHAYKYDASIQHVQRIASSTEEPYIENGSMLLSMYGSFTDALGDMPSIQIVTIPVLLNKGDSLLICSDGLWEMVPHEDIERILRDQQHDLAGQAEELIAVALQKGGYDNMSVILARLVEDVESVPDWKDDN